MHVGIGYCLLPFEPGRVLVLGGVKVQGAWGLRGRSDGDVVLQAVADALLGAAALGDLGDHFPEDDRQWDDVPSAVLLAEVLARLTARGLAPAHVDVTLVCERPELGPERGAMRERMAALLAVDPGHVSLKTASPHGVGALGRGEGISALAVASLATASAGGSA